MDCCNFTYITMAHVENPGIKISTNENDYIVEMQGFESFLLSLLMDYFQIDIKVVHPKDNAYGAKDKNGNWNGMLSMLLRNESQIAFSVYSITPDRYQAVKFSSPYYIDGIKFLTKAAPKYSHDGVFFVKPYSSGVWISTVVFVICYWTLNYILYNLHRSSQSLIVNYHRKRRNVFSRRLLESNWLVFSIVVLSCYSGMLTSNVSLATEELNIDSWHQLAQVVQQGKYTISMNKGGSIYNKLLNLEEGDLFTLAKHVRRGKAHFTNTKEARKNSIRDLVRSKVNYARVQNYLTMKIATMEFSVDHLVHFSRDELQIDLIAIPLQERFALCCRDRIEKLIGLYLSSGLAMKAETSKHYEYPEAKITFINAQDFKLLMFLIIAIYGIAIFASIASWILIL